MHRTHLRNVGGAVRHPMGTVKTQWRKPGWRGDIESIDNAWHGLSRALITDRPVKIQLGVIAAVAALAYQRKVTPADWIALAVVSGNVIHAEVANSAVEKICDFVEPHHDYEIKVIKDRSAGSVLVSAIVAIGVGARVLLRRR